MASAWKIEKQGFQEQIRKLEEENEAMKTNLERYRLNRILFMYSVYNNNDNGNQTDIAHSMSQDF